MKETFIRTMPTPILSKGRDGIETLNLHSRSTSKNFVNLYLTNPLIV
jgi:hypothetical protein